MYLLKTFPDRGFETVSLSEQCQGGYWHPKPMCKPSIFPLYFQIFTRTIRLFFVRGFIWYMICPNAKSLDSDKADLNPMLPELFDF